MEYQETILNLKIEIGKHQAGDEIRRSRQIIDQAALYLDSIFNLINRSALSLEDGSDQFEVSVFAGDLVHCAEIGKALTDSIMEAATRFEPLEVTEKGKEAIENFPDDEGDTADEVSGSKLALLISSLLNNPNLPPVIYKGLREGVTNAFNGEIDKKIVSDFENSPEYIGMILKGVE